MTASTQMARLIRIDVEQGKAGLFYATSPDLKGLLVAQPTLEELRQEIPTAIREMYAACGVPAVVTPLKADDDGRDLTPWVAIPSELARAALEKEAR